MNSTQQLLAQWCTQVSYRKYQGCRPLCGSTGETCSCTFCSSGTLQATDCGKHLYTACKIFHYFNPPNTEYRKATTKASPIGGIFFCFFFPSFFFFFRRYGIKELYSSKKTKEKKKGFGGKIKPDKCWNTSSKAIVGLKDSSSICQIK